MKMFDSRHYRRLVNLHSLIQDHERTLSGLVQKTDKHFEDDIIFPLVSLEPLANLRSISNLKL